jgi:endonuclease I
MNFRHLLHKILLFFLLLSLVIPIWAQAPDGYYDSADGKKDAELKTALFNIIKNHTQLEYYTSSTYFLTTDWHPATTQYPNGYFWDMYSNNKRTVWSGMNREHSMPKSWWSASPETTVAYSDLHNLYPSDATANSAKLNYGLGEVTGTPVFYNGVVKVGTNGFTGYTGNVFEPADDYKGDFARDYMYVVTCYEDYANNWRSLGTSSMLLGGIYPVFRPWAVNLLLKWHRQDPVSIKEIDRNNAVYGFQLNRNPFIDHPELAEFIWGKYMSSPWAIDGTLPEEDIPLTPHPNPASSTLTVKVNKPTESTFFIESLSGIVMKTGKFAADGTLTVDDLRNDMYLLVVYSETSRKVAKFVVQH